MNVMVNNDTPDNHDDVKEPATPFGGWGALRQKTQEDDAGKAPVAVVTSADGSQRSASQEDLSIPSYAPADNAPPPGIKSFSATFGKTIQTSPFDAALPQAATADDGEQAQTPEAATAETEEPVAEPENAVETLPSFDELNPQPKEDDPFAWSPEEIPQQAAEPRRQLAADDWMGAVDNSYLEAPAEEESTLPEQEPEEPATKLNAYTFGKEEEWQAPPMDFETLLTTPAAESADDDEADDHAQEAETDSAPHDTAQNRVDASPFGIAVYGENPEAVAPEATYQPEATHQPDTSYQPETSVVSEAQSDAIDLPVGEQPTAPHQDIADNTGGDAALTGSASEPSTETEADAVLEASTEAELDAVAKVEEVAATEVEAPTGTEAGEAPSPDTDIAADDGWRGDSTPVQPSASTLDTTPAGSPFSFAGGHSFDDGHAPVVSDASYPAPSASPVMDHHVADTGADTGADSVTDSVTEPAPQPASGGLFAGFSAAASSENTSDDTSDDTGNSGGDSADSAAPSPLFADYPPVAFESPEHAELAEHAELPEQPEPSQQPEQSADSVQFSPSLSLEDTQALASDDVSAAALSPSDEFLHTPTLPAQEQTAEEQPAETYTDAASAAWDEPIFSAVTTPAPDGQDIPASGVGSEGNSQGSDGEDVGTDSNSDNSYTPQPDPMWDAPAVASVATEDAAALADSNSSPTAAAWQLAAEESAPFPSTDSASTQDTVDSNPFSAAVSAPVSAAASAPEQPAAAPYENAPTATPADSGSYGFVQYTPAATADHTSAPTEDTEDAFAPLDGNQATDDAAPTYTAPHDASLTTTESASEPVLSPPSYAAPEIADSPNLTPNEDGAPRAAFILPTPALNQPFEAGSDDADTEAVAANTPGGGAENTSDSTYAGTTGETPESEPQDWSTQAAPAADDALATAPSHDHTLYGDTTYSGAALPAGDTPPDASAPSYAAEPQPSFAPQAEAAAEPQGWHPGLYDTANNASPYTETAATTESAYIAEAAGAAAGYAAAGHGSAAGESQFNGEDLQGILQKHSDWLNSGGRDGKRANFRNANLRGVNLSNAQLAEASLRGADLSGAFFNGADLRGADLSESLADGTDFSHAHLTSAIFARADLRTAIFNGADLQGADFSNAMLIGAQMNGLTLAAAVFQDAQLAGVQLQGANLSGANLRGATLTGANLSDADLSGANCRDVSFDSAVLDRVNLHGASLKNARMQGASLLGTDLSTAEETSDEHRHESFLSEKDHIQRERQKLDELEAQLQAIRSQLQQQEMTLLTERGQVERTKRDMQAEFENVATLMQTADTLLQQHRRHERSFKLFTVLWCIVTVLVFAGSMVFISSLGISTLNWAALLTVLGGCALILAFFVATSIRSIKLSNNLGQLLEVYRQHFPQSDNPGN